MYHLSQRAHEPTQLARLSLAKFSHTTTAVNHNGPLNWNHTFSNWEIFCHVDKISGGISSAQSQVLLRVLQNQDILEEVDLAHFAREASNQTRPSQNGYSRPIFAVVVKLPCLAVKYPTKNGFVRRFQLKFSSDRDFDTALAILSDIKCPFSESNIGSTQVTRKPTSSQWHSASGPPILGGGASLSVGGSGAIYSLSSASTVGETSSITTVSSVPPSSSGTAQTTASDFSATTLANIRNDEASLSHKPIQAPTTEPGAGAFNVAARTSTTPTCHDIKTLNQLLPPKRELPFSKPVAKRSRTTAKQPSTSPETLRTDNLAPGNGDDNVASPSSQAPKRASLRRKAAQNAKPGTLKRSTTSVPQLSLSNESSTQSLQSLNTLAQPFTVSQPQLPEIQQSKFTIHPTNQKPAVEDGIDPHHDKHLDLSPATDLSLYLSAPTHERTARLENWICQHIEDDGFLRLCQDVEGIWRRIAFGR